LKGEKKKKKKRMTPRYTSLGRGKEEKKREERGGKKGATPLYSLFPMHSTRVPSAEKKKKREREAGTTTSV